MWLRRERKDDVIWSDLKLGGHLELNTILLQSWSKISSHSTLTSFIGTNISRSSLHTTLRFLQVKHQHLMTNLQGLLSHVHILIFSKSNLKLKVFRFFSRFLPSSIIKTSLSEEPANTMSIHRVGNVGKLVILFHPCQKNVTSAVHPDNFIQTAVVVADAHVVSDHPQVDNSVGLRPRDVSYLIHWLNSYIFCNLQRSISARRKRSREMFHKFRKS